MDLQPQTAAYIEYAAMRDTIGAVARWAATVDLERAEAEAALDPAEMLGDYGLD